MEDREDNFIQLSALQHFLFCERQCALIHIEQIWQENRFTLEGEFLHEKADEQKVRAQGTDVKSGGDIAGNARKQLEKKLGRSIVSKKNYLKNKEVKATIE